jgi:cytoskeletal protein RodZ
MGATMAEYSVERAVQATNAGVPGFGTHLKVERQSRGISLEELSDATKIRLAYLEALENEDVTHLPPPTFTKGFIRSYCRHIRIDDQKIILDYSKRIGSDGCSLDISTFKPKSTGERMARFMVSLKRMLTGSDAPIFKG